MIKFLLSTNGMKSRVQTHCTGRVRSSDGHLLHRQTTTTPQIILLCLSVLVLPRYENSNWLYPLGAILCAPIEKFIVKYSIVMSPSSVTTRTPEKSSPPFTGSTGSRNDSEEKIRGCFRFTKKFFGRQTGSQS